MASDNNAAQATSFACRCLNVRIISQTSTGPPPDYPRDADYAPVFVKDDGISVAHPQVTVRLTSKGIPIPGTSRCSRFTVLTCLFCELPVYRVHQIVSLDVEGNETTLLPSDEWVEHEIMKSASGWLDVHKGSLTGNNISKAESSPAYASLFSLLLPANSSPSTPSPKLNGEEFLPLKEKSPEAADLPQSFLADLKPVFLPPPFTSSNPIFVHLAGIANKHSQELRASAEERIRGFIKAEAAGIEETERNLRRQVEVLWKNFRRHLTSVQEERNKHALSVARSPSRAISSSAVTSPSAASSSVTIKSFVPLPVSSSVHMPSSSLSRKSALSASLATSTFHHPRETQNRPTSAGGSTHSSSSGSSNTLSTRSGSSTLVHPIIQVDATNVLQFKRNINDTINTEASYRYFVNLEDDMQRYKESAAKTRQEDPPVNQSQQAGPSGLSTTSANGHEAPKQAQTVEHQSPAHGVDASSERDPPTPSRGRDKGKRKVTFDVQPAVVTIDKDEKGEDETGEDNREMIFDLEDLEPGDGTEKSTVGRQNSLPLLEQPVARPARAKKPRPQNNPAIDAFNNLRPSSLPTPSHVRPMRSQPGVDSSSQGMMISLPRVSAINRASPKGPPSPSRSPMTPNEHDAELLKLVAADTPSHRGAWTPGSKAWQTFTRRQDSKDGSDPGVIHEEGDNTEEPVVASAPVGAKAAGIIGNAADEDDDNESTGTRHIVGSLPVTIVNRYKPREALSLSSYRPQNALPVDPGLPPTNGKPPSSNAIRNAAYAERDRVRSLDPGPLDFASEDDEESAEDEEDEELANIEDAGEKARKQALRILQARSELPAEGMWRSLA